MKKSRGFTLVELLAVIVILAVILVIAIPNVIKIIDKARLDSYKRTEDMLVSAVQKYMASEGVTINTVGQTIPITYDALKNSNIKVIDKIYDQITKNECSNSKVYVTKTANGYTYKPGLVCDNYISFDNYNLLTNYDFSNGLTGWGGSYSTRSVVNGVLIITGNGTATYPQASKSMGTGVTGPNHKLYIKIRTRSTNSLTTGIRIMINSTTTTTQAIQLNPVMNQWYEFSAILTLLPTTGTGSSIFFPYADYATAADSNGNSVEFDYCIVINLTEIYGAGNEPSDPKIIETMVDKSR
jgi:type IV pilus assembly protein PilA